jgi:nicotinate phosphoribosyltransferase
MVQSYLARGMTRPATFSLFLRPRRERPWYVALGVHRVLELLDRFRYGPDELEYLAGIGVDERTRAFLADLEVTGELWAVPDGTVVLAHEPILELTAPLPVAQLLETAVINLVHHPTLVATKAARCALVAGGRRLADFGFRRAHGLETGVEAALAAFVGGGFSTSNVEAGRRHGIPVSGTMAHSYVQAFEEESAAFRAFAADHPRDSTLLVDTYDTVEGVRRAIAACREVGVVPAGMRLDSGDVGSLAARTRTLLDEAGFIRTAVVASGGLDEHDIHRLVGEGRPIDAFGIGTALVVSSDVPALDIVYKLVDHDGRPVAKYSGDKATLPGPKQVHRPPDGPAGDVLTVRGAEEAGEALLRPVWRDGAGSAPLDLRDARRRVEAQLAALPAAWREPPYPDEAPLPAVGEALRALDHEVRQRAFRPAS